MAAEKSYFDKPFTVVTFAYAVAFAYAMYVTTSSASVRLAALVFVSALPAILVDVPSWTKEFVGMAVMIACTCSPGAMLGHLGPLYEWTAHWALMAFADYACGGPQVNPAVTTALWAAGGFGIDAGTALVNILAQCGGGIVGWRFLLWLDNTHAVFPSAVGGPAPNDRLPWTYLAVCEAVACWTLLAGVFCFATTKPFAKAGESAKVYGAKMTLINATVRMLIILQGATGPAINPALATSYAVAADGEGRLPSLFDTPHYVTYWLGGLAGGLAMGLVWGTLSSGSATEDAAVFPNEVFKIATGLYLAAFAVCVWYSKFGPASDALVADQLADEYHAALKQRNVFQKVLRRKPKGMVAP
mmetsp:Transcript_16801/g.67795  ORF Transcript_16801/g.67795 Transcript_16801/m.67795 type:complete len:358 (+) Transcript_16801:232-1305(+)